MNKVICKKCGNEDDFIKDLGIMWFCGNDSCRQMINAKTGEQFEGSEVLETN